MWIVCKKVRSSDELGLLPQCTEVMTAFWGLPSDSDYITDSWFHEKDSITTSLFLFSSHPLFPAHFPAPPKPEVETIISTSNFVWKILKMTIPIPQPHIKQRFPNQFSFQRSSFSSSGESPAFQRLIVILHVYDPQASNTDYLNKKGFFLHKANGNNPWRL